MQDFNPLRPTELISSSRSTINNNMESVASHFSGTYFPTANLVAGMYCWRTDINKMYQLNADLVNWTLVNDMSQGYNSVAHANRADYATKDASGNDIATTYSKQADTGNIILQCYPVGSIYMSVVNTDPATLFGGTWQRISEGRCLIGASSSYQGGSMGGSESQNITLSTSNMPVHSHTPTVTQYAAGGHSHTGGSLNVSGSAWNLFGETNAGASGVFSLSGNYSQPNWSGHEVNRGWTLSISTSGKWSGTTDGVGNHSHSVGVSIANTGGGQAFNVNHMQPYLVVFIWQRVA